MIELEDGFDPDDPAQRDTLRGDIHLAVRDAVVAWAASRVRSGRVTARPWARPMAPVRWGVRLPDEHPDGRPDGGRRLVVTGEVSAEGRAVDRRRALLAMHHALHLEERSVPALERQEVGRDLVAGVSTATVDGIVVEVRALFLAPMWPVPADPDRPYADKDIWPDEACPMCGGLDGDPYVSEEEPDVCWWDCPWADHPQWSTPRRPDEPELAKAYAVRELGAAAQARATADAAADAALDRLRQAVIAARRAGVPTRRVEEVGRISPDTAGRWWREYKQRHAEVGAELRAAITAKEGR